MDNREQRFLALHPRYWPSWFGVGLLRLLAFLPLPLLALLGNGIGLLLYALHAPRRRVAYLNLARCFPNLSPRQVRQLVRRHFRAFGQTLLDVAIAWWAGRRRVSRLVRFRDRHYYEEARLSGRNVILFAPHFLGLEMGGVRLSLDGPLVSVFRHPDNELVRRLMLRARLRFGARLIEHNQPFTSLVRAVKAGTPLYYLPDQDAGRRHSVFAPFFGIPAATFTALARLARMTGAVVIPCITYQRSWGRGYEIVFRPPLAGFPSGDDAADATRMNHEIEQAVLEHREQYFWLHKRFKTRPVGEPKFY
ncbi:MAG: lysophospholipid acyltransferase family protein [Sulfurifustaceae bacterium]